MHDNQSPLKPDAFYHVYNRAMGSEKLFLSSENYRYFLEKYAHYIGSIANTFAFCLMPNHFHFWIQIKSFDDLKSLENSDHSENLTGFKNVSGLTYEYVSQKLAQQFSNLFNAYSKSFNKLNKRNGSLFTRPFKKKQIESEEHLKNAVIYIHQNPQKSGLAKGLNDWPFSSYLDLTGFKNLSGLKSGSGLHLQKHEVMDWFGDLENIIFCNENDLRV